MEQRTGVSCDTVPSTLATITEALAWDEAYRRVDTYLAALGIGRAITRHDAARQLIERAAAMLQDQPERRPVKAAMEELRNEIMTWAGQVSKLSDMEKFLQGRLALLLADTPELWHTGFLAETPQQGARLYEKLQPVPHLCPGRIDVQQLQLGFVSQLAEAALNRLERSPRLRSALVWGLFIALFGLLFYFTR